MDIVLLVAQFVLLVDSVRHCSTSLLFCWFSLTLSYSIDESVIFCEKVQSRVFRLIYLSMEIVQNWVAYYIRMQWVHPMFVAFAVEINALRLTYTNKRWFPNMLKGWHLGTLRLVLILLQNASNPWYLLKGVLVWHNSWLTRMGNHTRISVLRCFRHQVAMSISNKHGARTFPCSTSVVTWMGHRCFHPPVHWWYWLWLLEFYSDAELRTWHSCWWNWMRFWIEPLFEVDKSDGNKWKLVASKGFDDPS